MQWVRYLFCIQLFPLLFPAPCMGSYPLPGGIPEHKESALSIDPGISSQQVRCDSQSTKFRTIHVLKITCMLLQEQYQLFFMEIQRQHTRFEYIFFFEIIYIYIFLTYSALFKSQILLSILMSLPLQCLFILFKFLSYCQVSRYKYLSYDFPKLPIFGDSDL